MKPRVVHFYFAISGTLFDAIDRVPVKRRKIAHLKEDGGCGCEWCTVEVVEDFLIDEV
jgi:hypothetical protein